MASYCAVSVSLAMWLQIVVEIRGTLKMEPTSKNILIVLAHPEKASFNCALAEVASTTFKNEGHRVVVSDLYEMKFNPVVDPDDLKVPSQPPPDDVAAEQTKVKNADLIIFQFPMWWGSMPAIMKGWIDRVLCYGFAFSEQENYDDGKLKGKKALLSMTTYSPRSSFTDSAPNGDINVYLWPIQNSTLRFVGLDVLAPHINYGIGSHSCQDSDRQTILTAWQRRLHDIFNEPSIYFVTLSKFTPLDGSNPLNGLTLEDRKTPGGTNLDEGYTVGQHQGKKVPANSMTQAIHSFD